MKQSDLPLFEAAKPKAWTVTELNARVKGTLEPAFLNVWVEGELSNLRKAPSGHLYFSLKDSQAQVSAAIFGWGARKQTFELKDGLSVVCRGRVSVYSPRGSYQLTVEQIEPVGAGALQLAFEQLKEKLSKEGLFDPTRKRPLPKFPRRVAVVTSPTGAAIQDMLNILKRRAPHVAVTIVPALVQGDQAPAQIIRGIQVANQHALGDLVVVGRGGGSMEDLWCFNDEGVARAIAASRLPVISAVGHEIDFTISDFVADLRAPTPSAAAEILSGHWVDSVRQLSELGQRLKSIIVRDLTQRKRLLDLVRARLVSPRERLREQAQRNDELHLRLDRSIRVQIERLRAKIRESAGQLDALSPLRVLERGYTLVKDPDHADAIVRSSRDLNSGRRLEIVFHDGTKSVITQ